MCLHISAMRQPQVVGSWQFYCHTQLFCVNTTANKNPTFRWGLAEAVGFEPTVPKRAQLISSQSRYDHFDTLPFFCYILTRTFFPLRDCPVMSDCGVFVRYAESHLVQLWLKIVHWTIFLTRRYHFDTLPY